MTILHIKYVGLRSSTIYTTDLRFHINAAKVLYTSWSSMTVIVWKERAVTMLLFHDQIWGNDRSVKIFLSFTQSFSDLTEKLLVGEKFGDLDLRIFV